MGTQSAGGESSDSTLHPLDAVLDIQEWGTPPEERFDRITRLARETFGVQGAEINFLNEVELFTKSPQSPAVSPFILRTKSFCNVTVRSPELLVVPNATEDDRFSDLDAVTGERHVRFYAGRPLSDGNGDRVGVLCLVDDYPRELTDDGRDLLDRMGLWVERELSRTREEQWATKVQQSMHPLNRLDQDDFDIVGLSMPKGHLSGDFYDWYDTGDHLVVTLADVMGKGPGAALIATSIRSALRFHIGSDPVDALLGVTAQLGDELDRAESFATIFHARLDRHTGRLDYVDAGHGLSVIVRVTGQVESLTATGLPLGVITPFGWLQKSVHLDVGDTLITGTDGLLDLFDDSVDPVDALTTFGIPGSTAEQTINRIRQAASNGPVSDDITGLVITRNN